MLAVVLFGVGLCLYCVYPICIYNGWFLYIVLGCAAAEICYFIHEIYLKWRWLKNRTSSHEFEHTYGKVLDGEIHLLPEVWAIEKSGIESRFGHRTAELGIYGLLLLSTLFLADAKEYRAAYAAVCFIIVMLQLELNRQHALVIDELGAKIEQRCRDPITSKIGLKHVKEEAGNILEHDELRGAVNALSQHHIQWQEAVHALARKVEFLSESLRTEKDSLVKLVEGNYHRLLQELTEHRGDMHIESSLSAMHNALARLVQEVSSLRTDGLAEARKEIREMKSLVKSLMDLDEK